MFTRETSRDRKGFLADAYQPYKDAADEKFIFLQFAITQWK